MYTENEVLEFVKEEDVKFIRLAFFDLSGKQKNISIMPGELHKAFCDGVSFDASAIEGFEQPDKSDLFLHPDPSTLSVLPWRPNTGKVVRIFCNICYPDGRPYEKDGRYFLQKAVKALKDECKISLSFGTEIVFYLFKLDENGNPTTIPFDNASFMDIAPEDKGENIRREICFTLEQMGIIPESSHHEIGPGQNKIDFRYSLALTTADNVSTFKWIVRTKAAANGLHADFSPKPLAQEAGSSMHINISCDNLNPSDKNDYLPQVMAGIEKHLEEITYFLNPTEASYNRLGELKAPKYICCGKENRSCAIRIPATKGEPRIELRTPDPSCNPYVAFGLLIYAAIDGIKNNLKPNAVIEENLFDDQIAQKFNLKTIPDTLEVAEKIAHNSEWIIKMLTNS